MSSDRRGSTDANRTFGIDGPAYEGSSSALLAGKYALVRPLGTGGMASVHEAVHRNGNRVAIKVLHPLLAQEAGVRARFLQEGYAANAVGHPGVVRVLDDDVTPDGSVFLVMELLEGETLTERASRLGGALPETEVNTLGAALLDVLAAAHARGVVHRDIKPDNLFLTHDGTLKVLDFGIAQLRDDASARLTSAHQHLGTPSYMAPEQARGRSSEVDARTDVWAVGATMFTLLCGRPVHGEGSASDVLLRAATQAAPSLAEARPGTDPELVAVVDRALRADMEARWQDADAMREALLRCACAAGPGARLPFATLPPSAPSSSAPRRDSLASGTHDGTAGGAPPSPDASDRPAGTRSSSGPWQAAWALLGAVVLGAGAYALSFRTPAPAGGLPCGSAAECAAAGTPARCADGTCRPLLTEGCRLLAEPGDVENDDTIWLGAMYPLTGPEAEPFGEPCLRGVDLAREDFVEAVGGLPPVTPTGAVRRVAVVACDDSRDPAAVATHLIENVAVPAVIGFARSREVTELALSHFHPRGVVALAANLAPSISEIPLPADGTRLVYRVTNSSAALAPAAGAFIAGILEPALRAAPGRDAEAPLRVALVRVENASGVGVAAALAEHLRFNGRAALENGESFRQVRVPDALTDALSPEQVGRVADELVAFAPDLIVGAGGLGPEILDAVEQRWVADARPTYVTDWLEPDDVVDALAAYPDLRARVYRIDAARSSRTLQRFLLRYNERYAPPVSPSTAFPEPYDAFYLAALALAASGQADPHDGRALARAIPRLMPPGRRVEVSADGIAGALAALSAGGSVDLEGAGTGLDFDLATGDPAAAGAAAVYCLSERGGRLAFVDAGVRFDASGGVVGTPACE